MTQSSANFFSSLSPEKQAVLIEALEHVQYPAGQLLIREGDHLEYLYLILEGQVEAVKSLGTPDERLVGMRGPGNLLGEMSLFDPENKYTASVRAVSPIQALQMSRAEFEALIQDHPALVYYLLRQMSRRFEQSENATITDLRAKNLQLSQAYEALKLAQAQLVEKELLEHEMELARQIQHGILPASIPQVSGIDCGALMFPARAVGGDFYNLFELGNNRLGIVLGDVSDKGVPAALIMSITQTLVQVEASRDPTPDRVVLDVNQYLLQHAGSQMFVTLLYGILDCTSGRFQYARAGHPPPVMYNQKDKPPASLDYSPGQPVGILNDVLLDVREITLLSGDAFILYTDGVSEATNPQNQPFGEQGLLDLLASLDCASAQATCARIYEAVISFTRPYPQQDDIALICIRRE
ncbi:MAG: SpoIIE family protein phosphatase [Anaerolineales bacterium]|jgi:serine phosphatase RsbU (regulator of sigma subunit)|nr:SpoIIE family protein phosphatase [Anaerolineales bacterium]